MGNCRLCEKLTIRDNGIWSDYGDNASQLLHGEVEAIICPLEVPERTLP